MLENSTPSKEVCPEEAGEWIKKALHERHSLLRNFDNRAVDSKIYTNFEMEYYLSLVEYLDYFNKDDTMHAYMKKISNQRKKFEY